MQSKAIFITLSTMQINGIFGYKHFTEPNCRQHLFETDCNDTSKYCKWNSVNNYCDDNYKQELFADTYSLSSFAIEFWVAMGCIICYLIRDISTRIVNSSLINCNELDDIRKAKCFTYLTEFITTSCGLIILCASGVMSIIWDPKSFESKTPSELSLYVGLGTFVGSIIIITYTIEMILERNSMRISLKMHHWTGIILSAIYTLAMGERIDIDIIRSALAVTLYFLLEPNVFLQLLLYRINPNKYLSYHYMSTMIYIITRLIILIAVIITLIEWISTDFIQNELFQTAASDHPFYIIYFLLIPFGNIILNFAQCSTIQALIYMTKRVAINAKIRKELLSDPRIMQLHDIWLKHDESENGYLELNEFKQFAIFYLNQVSDLIIRESTLLNLWQALGYKTNSKMRWIHFKKVFKPSIKAHTEYHVKEVIAAKLRQLLSSVIDAEDLIKKNNDDKEFEIKCKKVLRRHSTAMIQRHENSVSNSKSMFSCFTSRKKENSTIIEDIKLDEIESSLHKKRRPSIEYLQQNQNLSNKVLIDMNVNDTT